MTKLIAAGLVLLVAGVVALWLMRSPRKVAPKHAPTPKENVHGAGIDRKQSQLKAMLEAPPGASHCESAWNAVEAEQRVSKEEGKPSMFVYVAPREDFLRLCNELAV